jgi:hypothetical protein
LVQVLFPIDSKQLHDGMRLKQWGGISRKDRKKATFLLASEAKVRFLLQIAIKNGNGFMRKSIVISSMLIGGGTLLARNYSGI